MKPQPLVSKKSAVTPSKVDNLSHWVGNLSPKGRVAGRQRAPVFGRQWGISKKYHFIFPIGPFRP
ncbi:MAG: hypothetical protein LBF88_04480 [Planctomycetaceae bacterium]|nr:hypothetical protein [Planctomycetaceae bacterium]